MTINEIAERLGVHPSAVWKRAENRGIKPVGYERSGSNPSLRAVFTQEQAEKLLAPRQWVQSQQRKPRPVMTFEEFMRKVEAA